MFWSGLVVSGINGGEKKSCLQYAIQAQKLLKLLQSLFTVILNCYVQVIKGVCTSNTDHCTDLCLSLISANCVYFIANNKCIFGTIMPNYSSCPI